ncbi:MAG: rhomboid family intramembrane serine protease [Bacteroides sp.]|nr:rhomboid family intramembrane serine protease [Bacteroides sp.]
MNQIPTVTKNLLIINVLCFLGFEVMKRYGVNLNDMFGLHFFMASDFNLGQLISYMFLHANLEHLIFNMFAVWMFGSALELVWGPKRYLTYYMVCGIGAGLIQELVQYVEFVTVLQDYQNVNIGTAIIPMSEYLNLMTTVGASGSLYGILLGFGMMYPNSRILVFFVLPVKAKYLVAGYALIELLAGFGSSHDGIAHFAHLGGMIFGFLLIMYWKKKRNNGQYHY